MTDWAPEEIAEREAEQAEAEAAMRGFWVTCFMCAGEGHVNHRVCNHCNGYGKVDPDKPAMTMERLHRGLALWAAKEHGWLYGCPIPSLGPSQRRPVIAKRAPFADRIFPTSAEMEGQPPKEIKSEVPEGSKYINSWIDRFGEQVVIIEHPDGKRHSYIGELPHSGRLDRLFETIGARLGAVTERAEVKAMVNLAERLTEAQVKCYILNDCFLETSKRSKVRYLFRKGRPTLALRDRGSGMRFLAALCMHPLAYYEETFAGSMAPSDDVLAHLLMMRADEKNFWRNCNQHPLYDPRSGV
jgi:hypothetical protein